MLDAIEAVVIEMASLAFLFAVNLPFQSCLLLPTHSKYMISKPGRTIWQTMREIDP